MKSPQTRLMTILATAISLVILFAVVYGLITNNPAAYTVGFTMAGSSLSAIIGYYFGEKTANEYKISLDQWRSWYESWSKE